ncbi:winged helix-turn-helix domain-containing protein [Candidatus Woesearchaeota archaeon]|nr:winged helix-turn-helix domain-containing protein [Candidatus Woesearchaeota archaeon]
MLSIQERKLIVRLHNKGKNQQTIADLIGCSQPTVNLWIHRSKKKDGLKTLQRSGRPTVLSQLKLNQLKTKLKHKIKQKNAQFGSVTTKEIREFIHQEVGELYSIRHVERIMHKIGFSLITPRTMHTKHDQETVDKFREEFKKKSTQSIWVTK